MAQRSVLAAAVVIEQSAAMRLIAPAAESLWVLAGPMLSPTKM